MMPGPAQVAIILFVILLLFGAKKLPQLARAFGESMRELKTVRQEMEQEEAKAMNRDSAA